jgi:HAD superfamily hydrolase (TIGR01490 family)
VSLAFFDVDGTLLPHPSLERRFFSNLLRHGKIPATNYLRWATQMVRLSAANLATAPQWNKVYLRGVPASVLSQPELRPDRWIPEFFAAAIQRVWWHALRGEEVVVVSGTLAPLAHIVKAALERELLWRGVETQIAVIATRLITRNDCWTGGVDGAPVFGEAKAVAAKNLAALRGIPLWQCFAYGDDALDRAMLAAVGNPFAVNPSPNLRRIALHNGWQVLRWSRCPPRTADARHALKWKGEAAR